MPEEVVTSTAGPSGRKVVIGVTGGIATGKSTVLRMLKELGAETIDADLVYHDLIRPSGALIEPLVARFGPKIEADDGGVDRNALGSIVFRDPAALLDLERLTHPAVLADVRRRIDQSSSPVIAVDAVKLIESGMSRLCDVVWLVVADPAVQRHRLMIRNGIDGIEANRRLAAQPDPLTRQNGADQILDNSGDEDDLRQQVNDAWNLVPKLTF